MSMTGDANVGRDGPRFSVRRGRQVPGTPQLSICILVLDHTALAVACLESLKRPGACPPDTEVVVVANGTPPDQLRPLVGRDDIVLVVNDVNLGFAAGCNQAAAVAQSPLLVFLNDDSAVEIGCLEALTRAAAADPAVGAVGSCILAEDGTLQEAGSVIWADGSATHVGAGLSPDATAYRKARDVDYASANGLLITRRAWDAVGGFDERYYPAYFEDVDLCLTLRARGFRTRYEPEARIVHRGSQSTTGIYRGFLLTRNQRRLVEKWGRALDGFEPRPPKDAGPKFDEAVRRAVLAASGRPPADPGDRAAPAESVARTVSEEPALAAQALEAEYHAYLEQRVSDGDRRVTQLETYLSGLWGVRLRRWLGGYLARRRA
jgi:GT2 family glycosyltransferase